MRYQCCIVFDLHEILEPDDIAVTDDEIFDAVRQISCRRKKHHLSRKS
jgi:hypothetical protein